MDIYWNENGLTVEGFRYWESRAKEMTDEELEFSIKDAVDARDRMRGMDCENKYADQVHVLAGERRKREKGRKKWTTRYSKKQEGMQGNN